MDFRRPRDEYLFGLAGKPARPLRGSIAAPLAGTRSGPAYDPDAQAYIDATGELFPDALNTLVLGIKAAGLWDDHIGSIKKAIGVPSLAASMIDLRNTAFNGTAVNTPTHSATEGWGFTAASSQYIDSAWKVPAAGSKATQNSVHIGARALTHNGGSTRYLAGAHVDNTATLALMFNASDRIATYLNDGSGLGPGSPSVPQAPAHYIGSRTASNVKELYKDSVSLVSSTTSSNAPHSINCFIGARNSGGTPGVFYDGNISAFHAGAGLDDTQAAALTTLFDAYATAAGEA